VCWGRRGYAGVLYRVRGPGVVGFAVPVLHEVWNVCKWRVEEFRGIGIMATNRLNKNLQTADKG
jgi:hypothetical protein